MNPQIDKEQELADLDPREVNVRVLAAIAKMDLKLTSISMDVQQNLGTTAELNNQLKAFELTSESRWNEFDTRLKLVENERSVNGKSVEIGDLGMEVKEIIQAEMKDDIRLSIDSGLRKIDAGLAVNINRMLEALDSKERKEKKLNVFISGLSTRENNLEREVRHMLEEEFKVNREIERIAMDPGSSRAVVSFSNWETKQRVLKGKKQSLSNTQVFIEGDLTQREQRIAAKLRKVARHKRAEGCVVRWRQLSIIIDEQWFKWDEVRDVLMAFTPPARKPGSTQDQAHGTQSSCLVEDNVISVIFWNAQGPGIISNFLESIEGEILCICETWIQATPTFLPACWQKEAERRTSDLCQ